MINPHVRLKSCSTAIGLGTLFLVIAGCSGDNRKPTYPVTGKVFWQGKPAKGAMVIFHPAVSAHSDDPRPRGSVADDGTLTVTTYSAGDGAPAGDYKLTIELWLSPGKDNPPTNHLPQKFGNLETSGLTATVKKEPTSLPDIVLKP